MHCATLADLAAVLSCHGAAVVYRRQSIPADSVNRYWIASRQRFDLWHKALGDYRSLEKEGLSADLRQWWKNHKPLLEEVLVSEILTRVYAAFGAGLDGGHAHSEISPVLHSVYLTHIEVRNRVLNLMLYGRGHSVDEVISLNRLRHDLERWTDTLIGRMATECTEPLSYAICKERAQAHAREARSYPAGSMRNVVNWLISATMRDTLSRRIGKSSASPEANQTVADAVMLCLRPDLFDSVGTLKSLWLHRLETSADQTDRVLNELAAPDLGAGKTLAGYEAIRDSNVLRRLI